MINLINYSIKFYKSNLKQLIIVFSIILFFNFCSYFYFSKNKTYSIKFTGEYSSEYLKRKSLINSIISEKFENNIIVDMENVFFKNFVEENLDYKYLRIDKHNFLLIKENNKKINEKLLGNLKEELNTAINKQILIYLEDANNYTQNFLLKNQNPNFINSDKNTQEIINFNKFSEILNKINSIINYKVKKEIQTISIKKLITLNILILLLLPFYPIMYIFLKKIKF